MMNCDTDGREMNCDTDGHIVSSPHPRKMENLQVGSEKPGTPRWRLSFPKHSVVGRASMSRNGLNMAKNNLYATPL